jgi:integrase
MALGRHGVIDLIEARRKAREALEQAEAGTDPRVEKQRARAAPSDAVEDVVEDFIVRHVERHNRPRTAAENIRALRKHIVPAWRGRSIQDISRRDIIDLLDEIVEHSPANANRTRGVLSKFFNWCLDRGIVDASPAARLPAPAPTVKRERVLSDDEIKILWCAFDSLDAPFAAFFKFLLFTGQRRGEVATMQWRHVDLEKGLWTIPPELVKANRTHEVPLSSLASDVVRGIKRSGDYIFTTQAKGDRPISGFSKAKRAVDLEIDKIVDRLAAERDENYRPIPEWRVHDLRRTCGTGMARLGVDSTTISRILNHAEGGVTKIYNRYSYLDEKRSALDLWSTHIESLVANIPS